jgi:predicted Zn-dependent peptidase
VIRARHLSVALGVAVSAAASLAAQQPAFDRSQPPALGPAPALVVPTVHSSRLASGAALKLVEQRELPLVQISVSFAGGGRLDNAQPGLASFVATMVREGAGTRDANALQAELAYLGATLTAAADWDNTGISLRVAKRNLEPALDLLADVILRPSFREVDVRRQRDLRLASLLQQRDQPRTLATLAFNRALFPAGHPYRRSLTGDSATITTFDSATVRGFHDGAYRAARATFYVAGDIDAAEARALLDRRFGRWAPRGTERRPAPVLVNPVRTQARRVLLVDKPGAAQSVVMIGAPGLERTTPDYAAIQVMNTILGGSFSSRLNTNLRETKGYTYGASSGFQWRPLPGAFVASADVRTNVTDSALVEFYREIRTLRDFPVGDAELARAKAYIALSVPGDLESTMQLVGEMSQLALFNLPLTYLQEYVAAVNAVTAADVQRVARRYVPDDGATIVIVGDLEKIRAGIEALNLGALRVVSVAELTAP